jgi:quercetin dioxygenase-like cupin family protein
MVVLPVRAYRDDMTTSQYTFLPDLAAEAALPQRGIHSQTLSNEDGVELVLFALAAGERLSEHTSARPAIVHVLRGEGELMAAGDTHPLKQGAWLRMAARTPHAVVAETPVVFALYLLPARRAADEAPA